MTDEARGLNDLRVKDAMRDEFPTVPGDEQTSKVLSLFANNEPTVTVVDDKGRYVGILSERDVLRSGVSFDTGRVEQLLHAVPTVGPDDNLVATAVTVLDANARALAVVDKDQKVLGVLRREDILEAAAKHGLGTEPIGDLMTKDIEVARGDDTVAQALSTMRRGGFSHLPVVEKGRLTGIVTVHDILRRVIAPLKGASHEGWKTGELNRPLGVPLHGIMTSPAKTLTEEATYADVAELFVEHRIGSIIVAEDGAYPRAIVTRRDLVERVALQHLDVPTIVVQFSSKDTSRDGYETSGAPREVRSFLERYQSMIEPGLLHIHVKRHKDRHRGTDLWHVRLNLTCNAGKFYAVGEGWGMQNATRLAVDHVEREVRRVKEERQDYPSKEYLEDLLYGR